MIPKKGKHLAGVLYAKQRIGDNMGITHTNAQTIQKDFEAGIDFANKSIGQAAGLHKTLAVAFRVIYIMNLCSEARFYEESSVEYVGKMEFEAKEILESLGYYIKHLNGTKYRIEWQMTKKTE